MVGRQLNTAYTMIALSLLYRSESLLNHRRGFSFLSSVIVMYTITIINYKSIRINYFHEDYPWERGGLGLEGLGEELRASDAVVIIIVVVFIPVLASLLVFCFILFV